MRRIEETSESSSVPGVPPGYRWNRERLDLLQPMRGEGRPPIALDADALLANIPLDSAKRAFWRSDSSDVTLRLPAGFDVGGVGGEVPAWSWSERKEALNAATLRTGDATFWLRTFVACAQENNYEDPWNEVSVDWAVDAAVALHGLAFAVPVWLAAITAFPTDAAEMSRLLGHRHAGHRRLRALLAVADAADYAAALAAVAPLRDGGRWMTTLLAFVFPNERDLLDAALADLPPVSKAAERHTRWLLLCAVTPQEFDFLLTERSSMGYAECGLGYLVNLVRLHGEAALPALGKALGAVQDAAALPRRADAIAAFGSPAAIATLIEHLDRDAAQDALRPLLVAMPEAGLEALAARVLTRRSALVDTWFARHASAHRGLLDALLERADAADRQRFDAVLKPAGALTAEADAASLPAVLRDPPWLRPKTKNKAKPLAPVAAPEPEAAMAWDAGQREEWAKLPHWSDWDDEKHSSSDQPFDGARLRKVLKRYGYDAAGVESILRGEPAVPAQGDSEARDPNPLAQMPPAVARAVWLSRPAASWSDYFICGLRRLIARDELAQLPALIKFATERAALGLPLCRPFACSVLVPLMAAHLRGGSGANKREAQRWLRKHAAVAARTLVAQSQATEARLRSDAEFALRWLAALPDGATRLRDAIADGGAAAAAQLDAVLSFDPLSLFPARPPTLPSFWTPSLFARPRLADGRQLPLSAVEAIGTMLAFDKPDRPYAGLAQVREACDPASLGAFVRDVFDAWQRAGSPSKEQWAFFALATLGDDGTARALGARIREWPGEGAFSRAVLGLDVMLRMGNDMALALLHGMAQKMKSRSLQQRAQQKLDELAGQRGLSRDELEDRVVPAFGLDAGGGLDLDFGSRRFRIGFDEQLRPYVLDEAGKRIKDLPKPGAKDDPALAAPASERFKQLKKDVRTVAAIQIKRLEAAMCGGRRWNAADFRTLIAGHPLLGHLARRLLWAVVDDDGMRCFRVAEDASFADANDEAFELPVDAEIVLPHPIALDAGVAAAFGQVFADYEILQPFAQLGRETYVLTDAERSQKPLRRWNGRKVESVRLLGLESRGWRRGPVQDGPRINWFERDLPGGVELRIELDPGLEPYDIRSGEPQSIHDVVIERRRDLITAAELGPLWSSEIVRDIESLL